MKLTALLSTLLLLAALPATAQQMNYQGRLTDASGNALADGQQLLEFRLFDAATGGAEVWGPFILDGTTGNGKGPLADLVNGRFNAVLGPLDTTGRPLTNAFNNTTRYLQIKVGAAAPISPRQAILDTPTAMMAQRIPNVFTSGANVGINQQSPTAPLHVTAGAATLPDANGLLVYNPANTAGRHAILSARVAGSAAGNPFVSWDISGEAGWSMGIDNADANKLKIGQDWSNIAGNTRLTIDTNGNVGVGTTSPSGRFDVLGQVKSTGSGAEFSFDNRNNTAVRYVWYADNGVARLWHSTSGDRFTVDANGLATISGGATINGGFTINGGGSFTGDIGHRAAGGRPLQVQSSDGSAMFEVWGNNSSNGIWCYGVAAKPGGGSWAAISDARLKKDVRDLTGSLTKLLQLRSVTFDYKTPEKFGAKGRQTGFIAQEVEKVFPEWVNEAPLPDGSGKSDGPKFKSVSISGFESITVQALRELRAEKDTQIKTLTDENTVLRDTVKAQEARLAKLEAAVAALAAADSSQPAKTTARR